MYNFIFLLPLLTLKLTHARGTVTVACSSMIESLRVGRVIMRCRLELYCTCMCVTVCMCVCVCVYMCVMVMLIVVIYPRTQIARTQKTDYTCAVIIYSGTSLLWTPWGLVKCPV